MLLTNKHNYGNYHGNKRYGNRGLTQECSLRQPVSEARYQAWVDPLCRNNARALVDLPDNIGKLAIDAPVNRQVAQYSHWRRASGERISNGKGSANGCLIQLRGPLDR
jgi:hypothetical protein